ncbi:Glycine--tRNA ligase 2-chloroplastic/mitochondrial [Striga hermonthica]|uniref:glycine--tRNA ligase n=1 Tax=Striga hermonthica TaxID=68872 RepID=A0A9N7RQ51_STRHE|nr:Glycine--tRNA ligase 2-chloroplastic/mitochondrial [Striga hermonthica]
MTFRCSFSSEYLMWRPVRSEFHSQRDVAPGVFTITAIARRCQCRYTVQEIVKNLTQSGNVTHGLRNTSSATIEVRNAESYTDVMQNAGIAIDIEERKKKILEKYNSVVNGINGSAVIHSGLLDEVMQKHQKYFAVTDQDGMLLPHFIAVANGAISEKVVRKGNEAVLRARYEDAKFFYELDTSKRFSEFRNQLKGILFHEKLGTMLDKMTRVQSLVTKVGSKLGMTEDILKVIEEAAPLAMSDLSSAVVTEFTSLAGVMGRHYALRDGYSELETCFQKTDAGTVLAISDRLESLVGLFFAGCQPSSANDPFGMRRISYGLVQLLVDTNRNLELRYALELAAAVQPIKVESETIDDNFCLFPCGIVIDRAMCICA